MDTALASLRATPAGLAYMLSRGRWLPARHLLLLNRKLADVAAGRTKRLIIEMPPRHGKSMLISHWFPVWLLDIRPETRLMLASYEAELAAHWGRMVRNTIAQEHQFLHVRVAADSSAANRWATTVGGGMFTAGVGGPFTGRDGDIIIIDDPVKNSQQANSRTYRESLWEWWRSTAYTRLEPHGAVIIVQTRWHKDDLAGRLQREMLSGEGEPWEVVSLPAIAGLDDPMGRSPGDPLWPQRFGIEDLQRIQTAVGPYVWNALYQQRPVDVGGAIFQREWWEESGRFSMGDSLYTPDAAARFISWDTAVKDNDDNAYSARVVGELTPDYRLQICEVWRGRLQLPALVEEIERSARRWSADGKLQAVVIEDKASGTGAIQTIRASSPAWLGNLLQPFQPEGDKQVRAREASVWCANGSVLLPHPSERASWLHDFEEELFEFPRSAYADQVDAFDQLISYLRNYLAEGLRGRMADILRGVHSGTI